MIRTDIAFDASAKTITFTDDVDIQLLGLIVNLTDGIIIYNGADSARTGTLVAKVLTLKWNTIAMDDTDDIQVFYSSPALTDTELRATPVPVSLDSMPSVNYTQFIYEDGDILYICLADAGSELDDAVWQVKKVDGMNITWAGGNFLFNNLATDLATVQAFSYS